MKENRMNPYKQFTGAWLPNWLLERKELTLGAKITYSRLAQYAGEDGRAYPKVASLADAMGVERKQAQRYLSELIKYRLIKTEHHAEDSRPSDYFFLEHEWMSPYPPGQICPYPLDKNVHRISKRRDSVQENNSISLFEPALEEGNSKSTLQSRFEDFWNLYPRKACKCNAKKTWEKIISKTWEYDVQAYILRAVENQKTSKNHLQREEQFIPHPATWLNQERWLDEIQTDTEEFIL